MRSKCPTKKKKNPPSPTLQSIRDTSVNVFGSRPLAKSYTFWQGNSFSKNLNYYLTFIESGNKKHTYVRWPNINNGCYIGRIFFPWLKIIWNYQLHFMQSCFFHLNNIKMVRRTQNSTTHWEAPSSQVVFEPPMTGPSLLQQPGVYNGSFCSLLLEMMHSMAAGAKTVSFWEAGCILWRGKKMRETGKFTPGLTQCPIISTTGFLPS